MILSIVMIIGSGFFISVWSVQGRRVADDLPAVLVAVFLSERESKLNKQVEKSDYNSQSQTTSRSNRINCCIGFYFIFILFN